MGEESLQHYNFNQLVGFTGQRGHAWWYRQELVEELGRDNHYVGAVPVEDALAYCLNFTVDPRPMYTNGRRQKGGTGSPRIKVPSAVAWVNSNTEEVVGVTGTRFKGHQYQPWLVELGQQIIGSGAELGSVGWLRGGARAYATFEIPQNQMACGVEYRRSLLMTTAFDSSIASTAKSTDTIVICDNTRETAMNDKGQVFKVRHSTAGMPDPADIQRALGLITDDGQDAFARELDLLCSLPVTDEQWDRFVEEITGKPENKWATTIIGARRTRLNELWATDERVTPWRGTAWGAIQANNTWFHHDRAVKNAASRAVAETDTAALARVRFERNMADVIRGDVLKVDRSAVRALAKVGVAIPKAAFSLA